MKNKYPRTYLDKIPEKDRADAVTRIALEADGEMFVSIEFGVDHEEVKEMMLDYSYDQCGKCRNFVESGDVADEDGDIIPCSNCRSE